MLSVPMSIFARIFTHLVFISLAWALPDGNLRTSQYSRVVVIPDVHGDGYALVRSLWLALRVVDTETPVIDFGLLCGYFDNMYANGTYPDVPVSASADVAVVQLGDLVDRGPDSSYAIHIIEAIPRIIGWHTLSLYGNHEIMSMLGVSAQFIHPDDEWSMGGPEERAKAFGLGGHLFEKMANSFVGLARIVSDKAPVFADPMDARNPATLFVHGGVDMGWLRDRLRIKSGDVNSFNVVAQNIVLSGPTGFLEDLNMDDSILWDRILANGDEWYVCYRLIDPILTHFKVARIILGHTPQEDRMAKTRCGGKIILADVMMSRWMTTRDVDEASMKGGRPVAIVMEMAHDGTLDSIVAHYTDLKYGSLADQRVLYYSRPPPLPPATEVQRVGVRKPRYIRTAAAMRFFGPLKSTAVVTTTIPPAGEEPMYPFPKLKQLLYRDTVVVLMTAQLGTVTGIINVFFKPSKMVHVVDGALSRLPGFPSVVDTGKVPRGEWVPSGLSGATYRYLFLETACVDTLAGRILRGGLVMDIHEQVTSIMHRMHAAGYIIGLSFSTDVMDFFGTNSEGSQIYLINWSRVQPSVFNGHALVEAALVRKAFGPGAM